MNDTRTTLEGGDSALAERLKQGCARVREEIHKLIVGQDSVVDQVLLTLMVGGNSIITGVPGLAKTLLIHTMAQVLDLKFSRIQFHPGPDAVGHHRHGHHPGGPERAPRAGVHARPDLRERGAGGRDQPHAAQDAGGAARGDAGAPRDRAGQDLRAAGAVLRVRAPRTRSSSRARIRCPRRSSTASCSTS
jgi:hypothetical protein